MMSEAPSNAPDPRNDLSGRQLGDFRLLRRLGRGATADVYLAQQESLQRPVAVKVLRAELAEDRVYVERFRLEAQAAAALVHANIVQIFEVGQMGRIHYIAQEYVLGQNLQQWLQRGLPPDLRVTLAIMRQVAAALAKAGEQGIVHRDIKPENILLAQSGEVKVADFGLARLMEATQSVALTQTGMTMGTPLYMSPEQIEGKPLDPRSDLYSLGVTCYQMLAGRPPFSSETPLGLAVQHIRKVPEPLEQVRPDLPPALCRIVHKLLAKKPEDRYPSARDVLRDLLRLQAEALGEPWPEGLADTASGIFDLPTAHNEAIQRLDVLMKTVARFTTRRPHWRRWAAAGVAAFLVGSLVAWSVTRSPNLLAVPRGSVHAVPKQQTAFGRWLYASNVDTEEAWKNVIEGAKDQPYLRYRAMQRLACVYLQNGKDDQAMDIFNELAALGPAEVELRAFGLAGQCSVYALRRQYDRAVPILAELWPNRKDLRHPQMRRLLERAIRAIRAGKGEATTERWQSWLEEQFPEAG
jgi:serine/threonine-protein kinase